MANQTIKQAFRKCTTGGSNEAVVEMNTKGISTGDKFIIETKLTGATIHSVRLKSEDLGANVQAVVGYQAGTKVKATAFITINDADGTIGDAGGNGTLWLGNEKIGDNDPLDLTVKLSGTTITTNKKLWLHITYQFGE